jgi:hypothetical protein
MALPDISAQFQFPPIRTQGNFSYKEAAGELGVPGKVATHRIVSAQRAMSGGTGDHARLRATCATWACRTPT